MSKHDQMNHACLIELNLEGIYIYIKHLNFIVLNGSPDGGQIITMPDPLTGQIVPYMIQTIIDPKTGKPSQSMIPLQGGVPRGNC